MTQQTNDLLAGIAEEMHQRIKAKKNKRLIRLIVLAGFIAAVHFIFLCFGSFYSIISAIKLVGFVQLIFIPAIAYAIAIIICLLRNDWKIKTTKLNKAAYIMLIILFLLQIPYWLIFYCKYVF